MINELPTAKKLQPRSRGFKILLLDEIESKK